jgi:hypothetical protein
MSSDFVTISVDPCNSRNAMNCAVPLLVTTRFEARQASRSSRRQATSSAERSGPCWTRTLPFSETE